MIKSCKTLRAASRTERDRRGGAKAAGVGRGRGMQGPMRKADAGKCRYSFKNQITVWLWLDKSVYSSVYGSTNLT